MGSNSALGAMFVAAASQLNQDEGGVNVRAALSPLGRIAQLIESAFVIIVSIPTSLLPLSGGRADMI
jgi:hypothetical protein